MLVTSFSSKEVDESLKGLNRGKARDPYGHIAEIFKPSVIGENLKKSLLILVNKIKLEIGIIYTWELAELPSRFSFTRVTIRAKRGLLQG